MSVKEIVGTLEEYKKKEDRRNDDIQSVYAIHQDCMLFLVSEAQCERLFSFFKRCSRSFMRKSLKIKSLADLGCVYLKRYFLQ